MLSGRVLEQPTLPVRPFVTLHSYLLAFGGAGWRYWTCSCLDLTLLNVAIASNHSPRGGVQESGARSAPSIGGWHRQQDHHVVEPDPHQRHLHA